MYKRYNIVLVTQFQISTFVFIDKYFLDALSRYIISPSNIFIETFTFLSYLFNFS